MVTLTKTEHRLTPILAEYPAWLEEILHHEERYTQRSQHQTGHT